MPRTHTRVKEKQSTARRGADTYVSKFEYEMLYLQPRAHPDSRYAEYWRGVVEDFPPDHFRESDRATLDSYVVLRMRADDVDALLDRQSLLIPGPRGDERPNPLLKTSESLRKSLVGLARSLKVTPLSRADNKQVPKESEHRKRQQQQEREDRQSPGLSLAS